MCDSLWNKITKKPRGPLSYNEQELESNLDSNSIRSSTIHNVRIDGEKRDLR
jgi:hypothetical protein